MDSIPAEGSWDEVMRLIGQAHSMLHKQGIVRIQTDIRVGSRYELRPFQLSMQLMALQGPIRNSLLAKKSLP